jgi:Ni/Co efflux regulator RcnB
MNKLSMTIAVMLTVTAAGQACADKPSWAEHGKSEQAAAGKHDGRGKHEELRQQHAEAHEHGHGGSVRPGAYFSDSNRVAVHEYYGSQFQSGRCPPGLAKKHNGCMPPGQAKKWRIGSALPRDVAYYEVPGAVVSRLGPPPSGYRYVRVAADILLIAVGTAMVVDAIQDIGAM